MGRFDLVGVVSMPALSGVLVLIQQQYASTTGDVSFSGTEIGIIAAMLGGMIGALVFVHHRLIQALEVGHAKVIDAKQETIGLLRQQVDGLDGEKHMLGELLATKERTVVDLLTGAVHETKTAIEHNTEVQETLRERLHALINNVHAYTLAEQLAVEKRGRHE